MTPAVTIVVPVYNGAATIGRTLDALAELSVDGGFEAIVVDGGSTDGTLELLRAAGDAITVLHNPLREPASSRNLGARHGTAPAIAFTDADCEPDPGWLRGGLAALAGADIAQGRVLPREGHGPFDRTLAVVAEYGLYETANLFVRRDCFERAGGFEPLPGLALPDGTHFGEDAWFVWRAKRLGARTVFATDALVRHAVFPRGLGGMLAELPRRGHFPRLVSMIPELRTAYLHRRYFLSPMSARFDLALVGAAVAACRGRHRDLVAGAGLAAPYALAVALELKRSRREVRAQVLAARLGGDAITLVALLRGSLAARTLVA